MIENKLHNEDCLSTMSRIEDNSIDSVICDPPYELGFMNKQWDNTGISYNVDLWREVLRIMKPGAYLLAFGGSRTYHRLACAIENAGFEIRDAFIWLYTQNQAKAMGLDHFINKMKVNEKKKIQIREELSGWKTPQIKSCFEPIALAQKPTEKTYLNNVLKYEVGLFNTKARIGRNMYPANVFTVGSINELVDGTFLLPKPTAKEKGVYNNHKTVKPLAICEYLIRLSAFSENAIILDPFVGSGTTAVAAKKLGKNYIGIDSNEKYIKIAERRLEEIERGSGSPLLKHQDIDMSNIQIEIGTK